MTPDTPRPSKRRRAMIRPVSFTFNFPGEMHDKLETWCEERGLTLAAYVRLAIKESMMKRGIPVE